MAIAIAAGATDQRIVMRAINDATGLPDTSIAYNSAGIDMWYMRLGATKTSVTEATLAGLDSAHSDGGMLHIDDGYFIFDSPDAAMAAGVDRVYFGGSATGITIIGECVQLNYVTPASIQSECEDALVAKGLDHLVSTSVTGTDIADNSIIAKLASKSATADWDTYDNTTDAKEAQRDKLVEVETTVNAITTKTSSLTFTNSGVLDCNVEKVNDVTIGGTGTEDNPFGPA